MLIFPHIFLPPLEALKGRNLGAGGAMLHSWGETAIELLTNIVIIIQPSLESIVL